MKSTGRCANGLTAAGVRAIGGAEVGRGPPFLERALGLDGGALRAGACGESACGEILTIFENERESKKSPTSETCQT